MGGLDMFKVEKGADGKFTKAAENLKSPMNSAGDDFGIIFEGKKLKDTLLLTVKAEKEVMIFGHLFYHHYSST